MNKHLEFLTILITVFSTHLSAQNPPNWPQELTNTMSLQSQDNYKEGMTKFSTWFKQQPHQALEAVKPYEKDANAKVRHLAFDMVYAIGRASGDTVVRSQAVFSLIAGCDNADEAEANHIISFLKYFKKADFSTASCAQMVAILKEKPAFIPKLARFAGFLEIRELIPALKEYTNDITVTNRQKWEAWLALARMDDKDAINHVLTQVKTVPVNDDVMYQFAPDLVYTRQHKTFDYLIEILNSDKQDCTSSNPDHPGKMVCAFRVMEYLAPVVEEFPLKIHASGDIDAKDYNDALERIRKWFKYKNGQYVIKRNTF